MEKMNGVITGGLAAVIVGLLVITPPAHAADNDIGLVHPKKSIGVDLMQALRQRKSVRAFSNKEVPLANLSAVLWAADGINRENGKRTAPSAHGKDAVGIYVISDRGNYRYDAKGQRLVFVSADNLKEKAASQSFPAQAPYILVLTGKLGEFSASNAKETALNYISVTAGAVAQNVYLAAGALGMGTCYVGSIQADAVHAGLKLSENEVPLSLMPLGYPK